MSSMKLVFIFAMFLGVSLSINCQSCQVGFCNTGGYNEVCAPDIDQCYFLTNSQGAVYRAGCAFESCNEMFKDPGAKCTQCNPDECNWSQSSGDNGCTGIGCGAQPDKPNYNSVGTTLPMTSFLATLGLFFMALILF